MDSGPDAVVLRAEACKLGLRGTGPFSALLSAKIVEEQGPLAGTIGRAPYPKEIAIYFPAGRNPGAEFFLGYQASYPPAALKIGPFVIDENNGAALVQFYTDLEFGFTGKLESDDGGLVGTFLANGSFGSDVGTMARGRASFCEPTSPTPEPVFTIDANPVGPTSTIQLLANSPAGNQDSNDVTLQIGDDLLLYKLREGPLNLAAGGENMAWPPNKSIKVLSTTHKDLMGRSFTINGSVNVLKTTATISDLTFTTMPPQGAIVGVPMHSVKDGKLVLDGTRYLGGPVLMALGNVPAFAAASVRYTQSCTGQGVTARFVNQVGATREVRFKCLPEGTFESVAVDLFPSESLTFLSIELASFAAHPQHLPPPPPAVLTIDDIQILQRL